MTVLDLYLKLHPCKTEERDGRPCMVCFHTRHLLAGCAPILPTLELQSQLMTDLDPNVGREQFVETKAVTEALVAAALTTCIFSCTPIDDAGVIFPEMALAVEGLARALSVTLRRFNMRADVTLSVIPQPATPEVKH